MADNTNHDSPPDTNVFSGYGDIDRSADSEYGIDGVSRETTNERSRMWNEQARASETPTDFGRAFPVAGSGGVVGDERVITHAYGES